MLAPETHSLSETEKPVVLICRDPGRRALLEQLVPAAEAHSSAIEAVLAVVRNRTRAVIVNLQDADGAERDVVAAVRRTRPDVAVYFVVEPEDEPAARRLVQAGAGDYFVMPTDVYRLPQVLSPPPAQPAATAATVARQESPAAGVPGRERPEQLRLFVSACAIADLAQCEPRTILREGAAIIFHALDATRGCLFSLDHQTEGLVLEAAAGETPGSGPEQFQAERTAAERTIHSGETLLAQPGDSRRPALCVPVQDDGETYGVLCISDKRDGTVPDPDDRDAAARLVGVMARLYSAAVRRERFAAMAMRDAETGLLRADAIEPYLTKLVNRAAAQKATVTVILLRPESGGPSDPSALGRLGRTIAARLPQGWQGARLEGDRFVVVGAPRPNTQPLPQEVALLYAARSQGVVDLGSTGAARLQAGLAEFPKDGTDARTLLAAATGRLRQP
jgi:GGDEF domain-containing protein